MGEGMDSRFLFWFVLLGISVNEAERRPHQEPAAGQGTVEGRCGGQPVELQPWRVSRAPTGRDKPG